MEFAFIRHENPLGHNSFGHVGFTYFCSCWIYLFLIVLVFEVSQFDVSVLHIYVVILMFL